MSICLILSDTSMNVSLSSARIGISVRIIEVDGISFDKDGAEPPIMIDNNLGILERRKVISQERKRRDEIRSQIKDFNKGLKRREIRKRRVEQLKTIKKGLLSGTIAMIVGTSIRLIL